MLQARFVLVLLVGCGGTARRAEPVAAVEPPPQSAEEEARVADVRTDPCVAVENESIDALSAMDQRVAREGDSVREVWRALSAISRECIEAGRGAWMFLPTRALVQSARNEPVAEDASLRHATFQLEAQIVFVAPDGTRVTTGGPRVLLSDSADENNLESEEVRVLSTADLDGDGIGELAYERLVSMPDDAEVTHAMLTVREGAVVAFQPGETISVARLLDHDQDGRMDVVNIDRYWSCDFYNDMDGTTRRGGCPRVLFHSLPGGGYSATDEVAASYLREQCARRPDTLLRDATPDCQDYPGYRDMSYQHVACARVWGESAADVEARIRREHGRIPRQCRDERWLTSLIAHARIDPPLTLQ